MVDPETLGMLARYRAWADDRLFDTLEQVPPACIDAPRPIVFGSLALTLEHLRLMDAVWQAHLLGRPHGLDSRNPEKAPPLGALRAAQTELNDWYIDYAESLHAADAAETVAFRFIGGRPGRMTRAQILLHVANHGSYHRGHVADMLYADGLVPPTTDLPVYLTEAA